MTAAVGGWLAGADGPVAVWTAGTGDLGVVLLPPIGYAYSSTARLVLALGGALAERGCRVLTLDYPGTGDSAGVVGLPAWEAAIAAAVAHLRAEGRTSVALVGVGWGASLALRTAESAGASAVVALAPQLSGRRYVRQLTLLGLRLPDGSGGVSVGGYALPGTLLQELASVTVEVPCCCPVLVVGTSGPTELEAAPVGPLTTWSSERLTDALERPAEEALVDRALVAAVSRWLATPGGAGEVPPLPAAAVVDGVRERFVTVGPGLPGIVTDPVEGPGRGMLVLLNSGSDPHPGPGRAWVELARWTAEHYCWSTLRFDARGWGRAPDAPQGDARPYDAHQLADLQAVLADLDRPVVVAGLCAGAWIALQAGRTLEVDAIIALNPQLYWNVGDPVEARLADTTARRLPEAAAIHADALAGRWDAEDDAGLRPPAGVWLDDLAARGLPVDLVFAGGDPGLQYLQDRLAKRLEAVSGSVRVTELPGIDHGMQQVWARSLVFEAFGRALARVS